MKQNWAGFPAAPPVNKVLVLKLAHCEFLARRESALRLGNSGTGKTHIALALGLAACQQGHRVRFTTATATAQRIIALENDGPLSDCKGRAEG